MHFYQQILGGTIQTMLTYGDSPMAASTDSKWHDRIVHATLLLYDVELTGVDMFPESYRRPQGFFITLTVSGATRAQAIFDALSAGGVVQFPFQKTFWSQGFGVVVDRFEVPWEINASDDNPAA
jgi:PhnB protein